MSLFDKVKKQNKPLDESAKGAAVEVVKALAVSIACTLIFILIFALIISWANIPDAAIMPVNQVIKGVSLLIGSLFSFKTKKGGWKKGLLLGILYVVAAYLIFSLMSEFVLDWKLAVDAVFGTAAGVICGIIAVNVRGRK